MHFHLISLTNSRGSRVAGRGSRVQSRGRGSKVAVAGPIGSLRIDDFPEDDDVSTLEVVYAHALPDVALFRASS